MDLKKKFMTWLLAVVLLCPSVSALAAMSEVTILTKSDIAKLSDEKLMDTYIDIIVELEASKTFHTTSGFTPKAYNEYKDLIKYRINLLMEIRKRGLEAPVFDNNFIK